MSALLYLTNFTHNPPCFTGATRTSRLSIGYKTPYSKETDEYDMQTRSTRYLIVDPMEKLLFVGYGRSSGK